MSSLDPQASEGEPPLSDVLRGIALALDRLGVLVLHLAAAAEERARPGGDDPLLTPAEAAAELRCSESLIRTACARAELRAMPNPWRIRLSALRAYERRRTRARGARGEGAAA